MQNNITIIKNSQTIIKKLVHFYELIRQDIHKIIIPLFYKKSIEKDY